MEKSMLEIGGVSADTLVKKVGTPLIVYDEGQLRARLSQFKESFVHPEFETQIVYASKAFSCTAMLKLVNEYRLGLDSVSGGELAAAIHSGFDMNEVVFHGNNKTPKELEMAITENVGCIVVDGQMELDKIIEIATELKKKARVLIRVNPGIDADTHKYIITANIDSKFGVSIYQKDIIFKMIKKAVECEYVDFDGLHVHIGSQIFGIDPFIAGVDTIFAFAKAVEDKGYKINTIDLGGGFAATYVKGDVPEPIEKVCAAILDACSENNKKHGLSVKKIMIEPGRSMVAEAGTTLYTVGYSKKTANKKYVFVDGGMADNIRPALYGAKYKCVLANRMNEKSTETVTVAGKCCESGDIIIEDARLPKAEACDILAVFTTGAYGYSMASNYNRLGLPAVVFAKDGKARCVIKRQSFEDMWALDCDSEL